MQLPGVPLSVCLFLLSGRCCRFAAVGSAGRRYLSIAAAAAGKSEQCYIVGIRRQLTCYKQ